ncbi:MAG: SGNH/GDSL hydrolase family protein [Clostridiales bacterium]|nr:SGNH/GDSL hydrolase family protein [Clostridiales bacterium]
MNFSRFLLSFLILSLTGLLLAGAPNQEEEQTGRLSSSADLAALFKVLRELCQDSPSELDFLPSIAKNRSGQTWAVWQEWGRKDSRLKLAQIEENRILSLQSIGCGVGSDISPHVATDGLDLPWVIWVNYCAGEYRVFVQELTSGRMWRLDATNSASIASPRLVFDQAGNAWAFWNEADTETGVIVYRVFGQGIWSPRQIVRPNSRYPALNPDVTADSKGFIWLTWASYDGHDYELYVARWNGQTWEREIRLTDNQENDTFPAIGRGSHGRQAVTWTRSGELGHQVYIASLKEGRPEGESAMSPPASHMTAPSLLESRGQTNVVWKSSEGIKIRPLKPRDIPEEHFSTPAAPAGPLFNPSLDENIYVCFGDSITYGYIDREPYPELGYVPRLDIILKKHFGPALAVNMGIGGENTILALARIDSVIRSQRARFILIMEGTNDVITPGLAMTTSAFNLREILRRCLEAGVYPVLMTIPPRKDWLGVIQYFSDRILELNSLIRQIVVDFPLSFVDIYEIFDNYPASDGGLLAVLSNDLKHPSAKGYQVMAESLFNEIKNIPFPPVDIQITIKSFNNVFLTRRGTTTVGQPSKKPSLTAGSSVGTYLAWKDNPKIFDRTRIQGYRVYRKDRAHPQGHFRCLAFIQSPLEFFDPGIRSIGRYIYVISAVRTDGVEGPCSALVNE